MKKIIKISFLLMLMFLCVSCKEEKLDKQTENYEEGYRQGYNEGYLAGAVEQI